ncbi:MAG: DegT/DnrJ/EryC1/StrS family aminotransferase [Anaerolineales bacterium]|nr:DegT/DnrJ/EryC1/StrS family aminotransferase [Anaerolineales bacterium]
MKNNKPQEKYLISLSAPDITNAERKAVQKVLHTPWLSNGKETRAFEQAVSNYIGTKYAVAVNSGTAGLHLCLRAAGISSHDLVITSPFSFISSSNVLLFEGAIPIFVDVDPRTGNIDLNLVEIAINDLAEGKNHKKWLPRKGAEKAGPLRGILPIDVFGQPVDIQAVKNISAPHSLTILEDSCEAIGAESNGIKAGSLADMGVFAFYPNKQITTGEGGMVVTSDEEKFEMILALRNQGRAKGDTWLTHTYLGYNYRMDEMSAALGKVQMGRLDTILEKRAQVAAWYHKHLSEIAEVELPQVLPSTTKMSWFVYVIKVKPGIDRDEVIRKLDENRIPSRAYFAPIHLQPFFIEKFGYQKGDFPITEDLGARGIALPFSNKLTEKEVILVSQALKKSLIQ